MSWWITQTVVVTVLLAATIELAVRLLRVRPAVGHVLWLIVLAKLVTPPVVVFSWPWASVLPREIETRVLKAPRPFPTQLAPFEYSRPPVDGLPIAAAPASTAPVSSEPAVVNQSGPGPTRVDLVLIVVVLWTIGALTFVTVQWSRILRVRRILRAAFPPSAELIEALEALSVSVSIAPPPLAVVRTDAPFVWALSPRRPAIVWPLELSTATPSVRIKALLLHELAHLKRGDHWIGWLELLAGAIWWWNPVFWLTRKRLRESAELACDGWVVETLPNGRRDYAEALLDFCDTTNGQPLNAVGISVDGRRFLKRRLTMIMRSTAPVRMSRVGLTACALLALTITPAWGRSSRNPEPSSLAQSETLESEDRGGLTGIGGPLPEGRTPRHAFRAQTTQASVDRPQQMKAVDTPQVPERTTPPQPATQPQGSEARRRATVLLSEIMEVNTARNTERIRTAIEASLIDGRDKYVEQAAVTADEAVRMALELQIRNTRLAYLDLVYAQQIVKSVNESLDRVYALVEGNRTRVSDGTMAPLDVVQARAEEARMRQQLVQAQNRLRACELALKRLTVGDITDPLWNTRLTPTDGESFRPALGDVVAAARADVQDRSLEAVLKAAASTLQNAQNTREFTEASFAEQQNLLSAGKSTNFQLVQALRNADDAKQSELLAILNYRRAEVQLNRVQTSAR